MDGHHSVGLTGIDGLEVSSYTGVSFTVDTVPPTVLLISPSGDQVSTRAKIAVTFSEAMDRNATAIGLAGIDGLTVWNGSTATFIPSATLIGHTTYTVCLTGKDLSGNGLGNITRSFTTADVGTVSGKITGADGSPVANATVSLTSGTGSTNASYISSSQTDTGGTYLFYDVPAGNYTLKVTKDGYNSVTSSLAMTSDDVAAGGVAFPVMIAVTGQASDIGPVILIVAMALAAILLSAAVVAHRKHRKA
jgi:hypothetical protein